MYFTYVLKCTCGKDGRELFYIEYTENLEKRLRDHHLKSVETTKDFEIIENVYYEACLNKTDAIKRENQLKTGFGRGYLKRRLENYLKETMRA